MNIIVLGGGCSTEREVSLVSGRQIEKALKERGHSVEFVDMDFSMGMEGWSAFLEKCRNADIVFLALHGSPGEDGRLQGMFDLMNIPYTGAAMLASAIAMDKKTTKQILREAGVPVPGDAELSGLSKQEAGRLVDLQFPLVVKPSSGGSSVGVFIVKNEGELREALQKAAAYGSEVLVEEYIPGRELTLTVLDGKPLPIVEIIPKKNGTASGSDEEFYDYEHKYAPGFSEEICPADLPEEKTKELMALAVKAYNAMGLNAYARFDVRMNEEGNFFFLEANTLPGMTPTSLLPLEARTIGMDFGELCEKIIEVSLER